MTELLSSFDLEAPDWSKGNGLLPAIIQDARSLRVLMLGYMNREALQKTLASGLVTFFSRTKNRLWQKGETSGYVLRLVDVRLDCDKDSFLMMVEAEGPTCHTGSRSCFGESACASLSLMADLEETINSRLSSPQKDSYTSRLFAEGVNRIAQKVGEEGVEVALAGVSTLDTLESESADLLYHLLVLLRAQGKSLGGVLSVLKTRQNG